ncbi:MAG: bifunctional heptose 7-phosphate kinase/heptose 1-phosphate adenyltransferase [Gemmataceae bacterium]
MLSDATLDRILGRLPAVRVGVLGDLFLDRYLDIDAGLTEPSLETGLDAYQVVRVRSYPGAAGTVINNLAALGVGGIVPIAIVGDDGEGHELRQALRSMPAVDQTHIISWPGRRTPTYTKPMLQHPGDPARELNRLDIKNRNLTPPGAEDAIIEALDALWPEVDAWIVLDQVSEENCGVITDRVRNRVSELGATDPGKFVLADSRERIERFRHVCIKPNEREGRDVFALQQRCGRAVFWTRGEHGIWLFPPDESHPIQVPGFPVHGPIDPVGAGDSVSAGIASAVAAGASLEHAAAFGNLVASITIQQIGTTGTAGPEQVRDRWREVRDLPPPPHV